jgi:hypothetical protein
MARFGDGVPDWRAGRERQDCGAAVIRELLLGAGAWRNADIMAMCHGAPMRTKVSNEIALKQFATDDGRCVLSIIQSGERFRFVEEQEIHQPPQESLDGYDYWEETERSGLYETAAAAEREARASVAWLSTRRE